MENEIYMTSELDNKEASIFEKFCEKHIGTEIEKDFDFSRVTITVYDLNFKEVELLRGLENAIDSSMSELYIKSYEGGK